jgi:hypothetical protein
LKKHPIKKITVDVEALGGKVELVELTTRYKDMCNDDPTYDTPKNCLMTAGLTEEQYYKLGETVATDLVNEVIDLTYPNMRQKLQELMDSGEYKPPTEEEMEESKKN